MTSGARNLGAACLVVCAFLLLLNRGPRWPSSTGDGLVVVSGATMGTYYRVTLAAPSQPLDQAKLQEQIESRLEEINAQMSTYRDDSEISRFNRQATTEWFPVSAATASVVAEAIEIYHLSQGAFDVTVGPLVNLWGFGTSKGKQTVPAAESVEARIEQTGSDHLEVRSDPPALRKDLPELRVDLSGIAKGFAVDALAESLDERQVDHYLVDIGGEMRAKGWKSPENAPWKIGIENPSAEEKGIYDVIPLHNQSIATSGDYRNFFEANGERYSHEIDPKTGRPVDHGLASVSVLHPSCMRADAWATALMVLGPERGPDLAENLNLTTYFVVHSNGGFVHQETGGFSAKRSRIPDDRQANQSRS